MTRKFTNRLLELMDEGCIDAADIVMACVKYMSEDEVADMMVVNDILVEDDEEFGDYDDSVSEAQEWADYDPDC